MLHVEPSRKDLDGFSF